MNTNRRFLSAAIGIGLLFILSLPAWPGTLQGPREPTNEEILRVIYPDGKLTKDAKNRFVIEGGKYAEDNVFGEGLAPKIIERIDRLRGRLYQKDREELVVLVDVLNKDAPNCCLAEAVLAVFDLRGEKAQPIWIHRLQGVRLISAELSLIEANTYGTQQILLKYETWGALVLQTAAIYIPRPYPKWRGSTFGGERDLGDQPFVKIWLGYVKWDEGPFVYDTGLEKPEPPGSDFSRATYASNIWFDEKAIGASGWKDLIEERTVTMLLGKKLDPPLKLKLRYVNMGDSYFLGWPQ
jgi:hypothetical protein